MSEQTGPIPAPTDPALSPPSGVSPCFESPYSLNPYQVLEIAACASITSVMLAARVYTKLALLKHFTWEDCKQNLLAQFIMRHDWLADMREQTLLSSDG